MRPHTTYYNMINWNKSQITGPPYLKDMSDDQIKGLVEDPLVLDVPSNTQFVERLVQMVAKLGQRWRPEKGVMVSGGQP